MSEVKRADDLNSKELVAEIVSAYVSHNSLPVTELRGLIGSVDAALRGLGNGAPAISAQKRREPAVPIKKSVTPDYLICLDDGKKFKSLRRHLAALGMTPEDYRAKWGLPSNYPMVAPNYAVKRSELAKGMGLGQSRRKPVPARSGRKPKRNGKAAV